MVANVWTEAAFNSNAWDFLTAGTSLNPNTKWIGQGESVISLKELIKWPPGATSNPSAVTASRSDVIMSNLDGNVLNAVIQSTLIGVGGKLIRKIAKKPLRMGNQLLKTAGLRDMIRM